MSPTNAIFVAPYFAEATLRFLGATLALPGVRLGLISAQSIDGLPEDTRSQLKAHWQLADPLDPSQMIEGAREIAKTMGPASALFGVLEQLQVPLAIARGELGLDGMDVPTAGNFRDKSRMKSTLRAAGLPCAQHRLATSPESADSFAREIGVPLVVKPPAGSGAEGTFRINSFEELATLLTHIHPRPEAPLLLEEFITGREHSFDSVVIGGKPVWSSVSDYLPTPLEVLENPWIQWCVLLPREISTPRYAEIQEIGPLALQALGLQTGLSHMEWFRKADGSIAISEVAARPPGAQITSLISYAHDIDLYKAWARLMITQEFEPPSREYAVGAAYFRGQGQGQVRSIEGLAKAQDELGDMVVEAKLPEIGQRSSRGYEGEGYAILRHRDTAVLESALRELIQTVRVHLG